MNSEEYFGFAKNPKNRCILFKETGMLLPPGKIIMPHTSLIVNM